MAQSGTVRYRDLQVTCPTVYCAPPPSSPRRSTVVSQSGSVLECTKLDLEVDVYFSTLTVKMVGQWRNHGDHTKNQCEFLLPTNGTVTSFQAQNSDQKESLLISGLVATSEFQSRVGSEPRLQVTSKSALTHSSDSDKTSALEASQGKRISTEIDPDEEFVVQESTDADLYVSGLFRAPLKPVTAGERVTVRVEWLDRMEFKGGAGLFMRLPLTLFEECTTDKSVWLDICSVKINLHPMQEGSLSRFRCYAHEMSQVARPETAASSADGNQGESDEQKDEEEHKDQDQIIKKPSKSTADRVVSFQTTDVLMGPDQDIGEAARFGRDFAMAFGPNRKEDEIGLFALKQPLGDGIPGMEDYRSLMSTFVIPPIKEESLEYLPRCVYFLVDRSNSMLGEPWSQVAMALEQVVSQQLRKGDYFNVICFDSNIVCFRKEPTKFTEVSGLEFGIWMDSLRTRGGRTDIAGALQKALEDLTRSKQTRFPIIWLITDGSVSNEKRICDAISGKIKDTNGDDVPRIFTVGLGYFCNTFFLRQLASMTRGECAIFTDTRFRLAANLVDFAMKFQNPIVKDVSLSVGAIPKRDSSNPEALDSSDYQCFPSPIPDLYSDRPLQISMHLKPEVDYLKVLKFRGTNRKGKTIKLRCRILDTSKEDIPLERVYCWDRFSGYETGRLLWITASGWDGSAPLIALSIRNGIALESITTCFVSESQDIVSKLLSGGIVPMGPAGSGIGSLADNPESMGLVPMMGDDTQQAIASYMALSMTGNPGMIGKVMIAGNNSGNGDDDALQLGLVGIVVASSFNTFGNIARTLDNASISEFLELTGATAESGGVCCMWVFECCSCLDWCVGCFECLSCCCCC